MSENGNRLKLSETDRRFFNFVLSWARRYRDYCRKRVVFGTDAIVDFPYKAIHPLTRVGKDFVSFMRGEFPQTGKGKKVERLG